VAAFAPNALDEAVVELVLRLAGENPRWGYFRIVGECGKLGVAVSATSVRNVLRRRRLLPAPRTSGPSWSQFLRVQAAGSLACDFFHVDTIAFRGLYALFFIDLERPKVFSAGVTAHPVGTWVSDQAPDLAATLEDQGRAVRFLVRDRDAKFVAPFDEVMRSIGARVIRAPVGRLGRARSPNALSEQRGPSALTGCSSEASTTPTGSCGGSSSTTTTNDRTAGSVSKPLSPPRPCDGSRT
jgi:hypothetical protein